VLKKDVSSKTTIPDFIAERVMSALVESNWKGVSPNLPLPLPQTSADVFVFTTSKGKDHYSFYNFVSIDGTT